MKEENPSTSAGTTDPFWEPAEWIDLLAAACESLVCVHPTVMGSVTVTGKLKGVEGEAQYLMAMAKRFAMEYGLRETVQIEGPAFSVHFSRRNGALDTTRGDG